MLLQTSNRREERNRTIQENSELSMQNWYQTESTHGGKALTGKQRLAKIITSIWATAEKRNNEGHKFKKKGRNKSYPMNTELRFVPTSGNGLMCAGIDWLPSSSSRQNNKKKCTMNVIADDEGCSDCDANRKAKMSTTWPIKAPFNTSANEEQKELRDVVRDALRCDVTVRTVEVHEVCTIFFGWSQLSNSEVHYMKNNWQHQ
jgi:hypothetical protein